MRPFPWKCGTCGKWAVNPHVVEYTTEREHDGRAYSLKIPNLEIYECAECHARTLPDQSSEKVTEALRAAAGLLTPDEIRENRKRFHLTQEKFAKLLRVAKETVSRWERGGQIQQRSMDLLLRLFFCVHEVRHWLENPNTVSAGIAPSIVPTGSSQLTMTEDSFQKTMPEHSLIGTPSQNVKLPAAPPLPLGDSSAE